MRMWLALSPELRRRRQRELQAKIESRQTEKNITYVDDDGCEITVTPNNSIIYNMNGCTWRVFSL